MRRTPTTTDLSTATAAMGAAPAAFDRAFRELVDAWAAHEELRGDTDQLPELAAAGDRLSEARRRVTAIAR